MMYSHLPLCLLIVSLCYLTATAYTFNPAFRPTARKMATMFQKAINGITSTPKDVKIKDLKRIFHIHNDANYTPRSHGTT